MLSFFGGKKRSHRRKMELWARQPNAYVASISEFDPVPFMRAADLLISDVSSVLFEFAAADKPVVWCDFLWVHWTRRGPLRHRLWRRLDASLLDFADICPHAKRFGDLRGLVEAELAQPERFAAKRRAITHARLGPTDGRTSERIADYLVAHAEAPARRRRRRARGRRRPLIPRSGGQRLELFGPGAAPQLDPTHRKDRQARHDHAPQDVGGESGPRPRRGTRPPGA